MSDRKIFGPLKGWFVLRPDYDQQFEGWKVYAQKPDSKNAIPVEIRIDRSREDTP